VTVSSAEASSLSSLNATEAVARMAHGELTAERYCEALLARCHAHRALNAFITLEPQRVLEHARARDLERLSGTAPGPLFGLPIPVKDSINTRDYATTGGTPALRHFRPAADAPIVASLKAAGAILLGKTNLHELSYGWASNNHAFGAVHNPYHLAHIAGGSSGGTAAAVAARLAPLGVSEDTEGSIRVPAAFCGIAGFRPTTGRYSTAGCIPITALFDQVGPHARCVADLALFDSVAANDWAPLDTRSLKGLRLGIVRDYWFTGLEPEVERITALALNRLRDAGVTIVEGSIPDLANLVDSTSAHVQNHDVLIALARYLRDYDTHLTVEEVIARASPDIREFFLGHVLPGGPHVVSERTYRAARDRHLPSLRRCFNEYFSRDRVAALVFPTTRVPAPLIGEETTLRVRGYDVPFETAVARNISPGSSAGLPGLVLPAGISSTGLPIGIEFDAPAGADRALLALGIHFECALGSVPGPAQIA
jgi:Asp-tRNA(Asn)/Glu-tRNA(Gln) amidotransferase A subunit family amidase